jgi:ABC-type multidrug transport system ATPase subunit
LVEITGKVASLLDLGSGFHPEFTGRENLRLNGMIAGFEAQELERKVEDMLKFSELGEFSEFPVRTYSDGMYLRLGFSLAQALAPDLFLIDEALAVGDEYFRSKCLRRMLEFKEQGVAMMIASHDLTMVRGLCDLAAYLEKGELRKIGPAGEVIESYLDGIYQEAMGSVKIKPEGEWKRRGSGEAKIVSVRMRNGQGGEAAIFRTGEQIEIEFGYRADSEIKEPLFGVNVFRSDGVLVLSTNQECAAGPADEFGRRVENKLAGPIPARHSGVVTYQFQNPLLPGRYQLSVNIFSGKSGAALAVDEVFDVVRFEVGPGKIMDRGVFLNPCVWKIG